MALGIGAILQAIFDHGYAGYIVGGAIELVAVAIGWAFLGTGKQLFQAGESKRRATVSQAAFALAAHRGGIVTARELAQAINVSVAEADQLLTDFAKTQHEDVSLEFDDSGSIYYRFKRFAPPALVEASPLQVRVEELSDAELVTPPQSATLNRRGV
ncbi:MAG: hypothetical protein IPK60_08210 [Sandaracinaceae bacterium]|nr:hypothetical protein [Sandaracinaceae bacterium]